MDVQRVKEMRQFVERITREVRSQDCRNTKNLLDLRKYLKGSEGMRTWFRCPSGEMSRAAGELLYETVTCLELLTDKLFEGLNRTNAEELLTIDSRELRQHSVIGQGTFGTVWKGTYMICDVAIKVSRMDAGNTDWSLRNEFSVLQEMRSPYIVTLYGIVSDPTTVSLVYEYMPLDLARAAVLPDFDGGKKIQALLDVACALKHLQSRGLLHRDVKPANVLLDKNMRAKLGDFGCAIAKNRPELRDERYRVQGTCAYMAPEIAFPDMPLDLCDNYSFGMLMYAVFTQGNPYPDRRDFPGLVRDIYNGMRPTPEPDEKMPKRILSLYRQCIALDLKERAKIEKIIQSLNMALVEWYVGLPSAPLYDMPIEDRKAALWDRLCQYRDADGAVVSLMKNDVPETHITSEIVGGMCEVIKRKYCRNCVFTLQAYGDMIKKFGNWYSSVDRREELANELRQDFFQPMLSEDMCVFMLRDCHPGTYIVRNGSDPSTFTVHYVTESKRQAKVRIFCHETPEGMKYHPYNTENPGYPTLKECLRNMRDRCSFAWIDNGGQNVYDGGDASYV